MNEEWINDNIWHCNDCGITFKVYALDEEPSVSFCPVCSSRDIEGID